MEENSRNRVLGMLRDGLITVEEAEQLLGAMEQKAGVQAEPVSLKDNRGRKPKKFRIVVDSESEDKKAAKVNISIPVSLIKTFGPIVTKTLNRETREELEKSGVNLQEILDSIDSLLESGMEEDIIYVDAGEGEGKSKVRIYVE